MDMVKCIGNQKSDFGADGEEGEDVVDDDFGDEIANTAALERLPGGGLPICEGDAQSDDGTCDGDSLAAGAFQVETGGAAVPIALEGVGAHRELFGGEVLQRLLQ